MLLRRRQLDLLRRAACSPPAIPDVAADRALFAKLGPRARLDAAGRRAAAALSPELERALARRARRRACARHRRTLESPQGPRVVVDGRALLAFASNDYLGLADDPALVAAAREGVARWGVGAGASHLVCGHSAPHAALEDELAAFVAPCDGARALTFSTGYLANLAILTALAGRGDAIFADRLNHACLNDGALLSRAKLVRYPHGDVDALDARLAASTRAAQAHRHRRGVQHGRRHRAAARSCSRSRSGTTRWLVVDDAHGFGVLGRRPRQRSRTSASRRERIVYMGTLGKAAGVAGAFVAAHPAVDRDAGADRAAYIYTTAAPPLLARRAVARRSRSCATTRRGARG